MKENGSDNRLIPLCCIWTKLTFNRMVSFKPGFSGDLHLTTWKVIILTPASAHSWTFLHIRTPKWQSELSALERCPLYKGHQNDVTLFKASLQTLVLTEYNLTCSMHSISSWLRFTSQLHIRISLKLVVKHAIMQCCTDFNVETTHYFRQHLWRDGKLN